MFMSKYKATIGLEIHAELKTVTKLFCNSKNDPDEKKPNANICPVCMGYPGTLPVINKEAIRHMIRVGLAIGGTIASNTYFDRKNYFYPDIPKGYQISQYKHPLVSGGSLTGVSVERVHLEEDTARSLHKGDKSLIDFNRAGVPLMELVTKPVIKNVAEAVFFAKELQLLLRTLGASEANMEKGEMRVEANVSVSSGSRLGTKVEVKNLNSFRAVKRAIIYEIKRQSDVLDKKNKVIQETRGWDEIKNKTFSQRLKEEAQEYRYFPEPDLTAFKLGNLSEFGFEKLEEALPELPWEKRDRYKKTFGIKNEDIEIYINDSKLADFFEKVVRELKYDKNVIQLASNYFISDYVPRAGASRDFKIGPSGFAGLIRMVHEGIFSSRSVKGTLELIYKYNEKVDTAQDIRNFTQRHRISNQQSDEEVLKRVVKKIIEENPKVVKDYKGGKIQVLQYLVGQGMKATRGSGNPKMLQELFIKLLH